MKASLIEQYDLTLTKREMDELMLALRVYVRDFDASPLAEELLEALDEVYVGPRLGQRVTIAGIDLDGDVAEDDESDEDDEGGSAVKA